MPRSSKASKPSAKRRLDFDGSNSGNNSSNNSTGIHKVEDDDIIIEDHKDDVEVSSSTPSNVKSTPVKKKRRMESYFSPVAASQKNQSASAVVTPEKLDTKPSVVKKDKVKKAKAAEDDHHAYVPVYIHKNLNYQRSEQASIPEELKQSFALVEEYFEIPRDFESNTSYGPLSGTCFEERVVEAYNHGLLKSKDWETNNDDGTIVKICSHCATTGHKREDCPELI
ncbi:MAG: hypothetical protein SGILL_000230 [Bacillariaceae sp.]